MSAQFPRSATVFVFALVHAALYCCLLPLWEGFDEPFHYSYVQSFAADGQIPVLRQTTISKEIRTSLNLLPVSFILKRYIPGTLSFEDWFAFSQQERVSRAERVRTIAASERYAHSSLLNYEAQQTPLAYLLLAPVDAALSGVALPPRILVLRLISAFGSTVLTWIAFDWLCRTLGLGGGFRLAALALFFQMQIYEAAVAHVANDWLSIAAGAWFFAGLAALARWNRRRDSVILAVALAIGLLAKAYCLAFVPVFLLVLAIKLFSKQIALRTALISTAIAGSVAAPWYLRNLLIYRSLAGLQENVKGVTEQDAFYAFTHIHWGRALIESARWGLWIGNESHLSFSQNTLNLFLFLLFAGFICYLAQIRRTHAPEWWVLLAVIVFILALLYDLCVAWADTHGGQNTTGPYYTPCILPAIFALMFLGLQRSGKAGRFFALAISLTAMWISVLTYLAKLLPYYGGMIGRSTFLQVLHWWTTPPGREILSVTTLGTSVAVYTLLFCYLALLLWMGWQTAALLLFKDSFEQPLRF